MHRSVMRRILRRFLISYRNISIGFTTVILIVPTFLPLTTYDDPLIPHAHSHVLYY